MSHPHAGGGDFRKTCTPGNRNHGDHATVCLPQTEIFKSTQVKERGLIRWWKYIQRMNWMIWWQTKQVGLKAARWGSWFLSKAFCLLSLPLFSWGRIISDFFFLGHSYCIFLFVDKLLTSASSQHLLLNSGLPMMLAFHGLPSFSCLLWLLLCP